MRTIAVIQGCPIREDEKGRVFFTADADIDCDGSGGNPDNDPYFQPDTSLHHNGKALNAYQESFIVVPPQVVSGVKGVVLGCQARVHYLRTGKIVDAVVGDVGPSSKVGELSVWCATLLEMKSNPNTGGEDDYTMVVYELLPGKAALVGGIQYELQPS